LFYIVYGLIKDVVFSKFDAWLEDPFKESINLSNAPVAKSKITTNATRIIINIMTVS